MSTEGNHPTPTGDAEPRCPSATQSKLGGADDVKTCRPEADATTPWNAHLKDKLESRRQVRSTRGTSR